MQVNRSGPLGGGRLGYLFIMVRDFPAMLSFYRDILGLHLVYLVEEEAAFFRLGAGLDGEGPQIALYAGRKDAGAGTNHWFLVVDVSDIEGTVAALRERGVEVGEIEDVPFGRAATFADPEGNLIEVHAAASN